MAARRTEGSGTPGAAGLAAWERALRLFVRIAVVVIVVVNIANAVSILYGGRIEWFLLNTEGNLSTWFSSVMLLVAAVLSLLCLAASPARDRRWWLVLTVLLVGMSLDESATIHEHVDTYLVRAVNPSMLTYLWVVPGAVAVLLVSIAFAGFLRRQPSATRLGCYLAAALFVSGAIGMETVSGWWASGHGDENTAYLLLTTAEENLEMLGALVAIVVLARHAALAGVRVDVTVAP